MRTPCYVAFATLLVCGCEAPTPQLSVRMDSTAYNRDSDGLAHASFTVTNVGSAPAVTTGCPPPAFATDTGSPGRWSAYTGDQACENVLVTVQVLQPGQSVRGSFSWDWPATYRIRVYYSRDQADPGALQSAGGAFAIR